MSSAEIKSEGAASNREKLPWRRTFAWSVRRELWEYRSVWIAPLAASGVVLFSFVLRMVKLPKLLHVNDKLPPMAQAGIVAAPFAFAAGAILVTGFILSVFYCLGALGNERRDRSILFWKSLPVSNIVTVLSKAFVPFVLVPLVVCVIAIATQLIMLLLGSAVFAANGIDASLLWSRWPMPRMAPLLIYFVAISVLWYAPIYGWLLMISSWARRVAFLWAVLPWLGLALIERIALDSGYVWSFLSYRFHGAVTEGFVLPPDLKHQKQMIDPLATLAPGHFFATPGLWLGLLAAGVFIAAAIWFRRTSDPT